MGSSSSKKSKRCNIRPSTELPLHLVPEVWMQVVSYFSSRDIFSCRAVCRSMYICTIVLARNINVPATCASDSVLSCLGTIAGAHRQILRSLVINHKSIGTKNQKELIKLLALITSIRKLHLRNFGVSYRQNKLLPTPILHPLLSLTQLQEVQITEDPIRDTRYISSFQSSLIGDDDVLFLHSMKRLKTLHLVGHSDLTGNSLIPILKNNSNLTELNLLRSQYAAEDIGEILSELPLVSLSYEELLLGESGIPSRFGRMTSLRFLALHHADPVSLLQVRKLKNLVHLDLSGCYGLMWPDLDVILRRTKQVEVLALNWNRQLHDISAVLRLPKLRELEFVNGQVSTSLLRATLAKLSRSLVRLSLAHNTNVDKSCIQVLATMTRLTSLDLSGCCEVPLSSVACFSSLTSLQRLNLSNAGRRSVLKFSNRERKRHTIIASLPHVRVEFEDPNPHDSPVVHSLLLEQINHIGW